MGPGAATALNWPLWKALHSKEQIVYYHISHCMHPQSFSICVPNLIKILVAPCGLVRHNTYENLVCRWEWLFCVQYANVTISLLKFAPPWELWVGRLSHEVPCTRLLTLLAGCYNVESPLWPLAGQFLWVVAIQLLLCFWASFAGRCLSFPLLGVWTREVSPLSPLPMQVALS